MPIKIPPQYEMVGSKKSSNIKNAVFDSAEKFAANIPSASAVKRTTVDLVKRTASATKERAKIRGVAVGEVAAGGVAAIVAGFAAACVAGGVLKTLIDKTNDN